MLSELPDLDEDVSFVVDNGASTGPIPLREIVHSIRNGERTDGVLVWWAGATDWMRFNTHDDLMMLLEGTENSDLADSDGAAPHGADPVRGASLEHADSVADAVPEADVELDGPVDEPFRWKRPAPAPSAEHEDTHPQVAEHVEVEQVEAEQSTTEQVEAEQAAAEHTEVEHSYTEHSYTEHNAQAESFEDPVITQLSPDEVFEEPAVEAQVEQHVEALETQSRVADSPDGFTFTLPTRGTAVQEVDDDAQGQPALTGLFSAGGPVDSGPVPAAGTAAAGALDAILAARSSLESVGARIEALSSATRRSPSPESEFDALQIDSVPAEEVAVVDDSIADHGDTHVIAEAEFASAPEPAAILADEVNAEVSGGSDSSEPEVSVEELDPVLVSSATHAMAVGEDTPVTGSWHAVADESPATTSSAPVAERVDYSESTAANVASRLLLTERFEEMVRKSMAHQRRIEWVMRIDELLLSACITAIADSGFVAMDLTSRESDHRVLFEHNSDSRHVRLDLAPVEVKDDHIGRHVRFGLTWGRKVANIDDALETVGREAVDGTIPPGVLTCSADMSNSVVSTHVELILAADDLVKDDYSVDRPALDASIAATLHALEERWKILFTAG